MCTKISNFWSPKNHVHVTENMQRSYVWLLTLRIFSLQNIMLCRNNQIFHFTLEILSFRLICRLPAMTFMSSRMSQQKQICRKQLKRGSNRIRTMQLHLKKWSNFLWNKKINISMPVYMRKTICRFRTRFRQDSKDSNVKICFTLSSPIPHL